MIRNSLRTAPSRYKLDIGRREPRELGSLAGNANADEMRSNHGPRRSAPSLAAAKTMTLLSDTGASNHSCNTRDLTEEQKKHIRPLEQPVVLDTANGPIVVDSYIEIELLKLAAARPLRFLVSENSPNLLSVG